MRARFFFGEVGSLDVHTEYPRADRWLFPKRLHGAQGRHDGLVRSRHGGKCQRGRAAAGMVAADGAKGFRIRLHGVAVQRTVDVQIDEARREKTSAKIHRLFAGLRG